MSASSFFSLSLLLSSSFACCLVESSAFAKMTLSRADRAAWEMSVAVSGASGSWSLAILFRIVRSVAYREERDGMVVVIFPTGLRG